VAVAEVPDELRPALETLPVRVDVKVNRPRSTTPKVRRQRPSRRDPTAPPDNPFLDIAERERMLAARASQARKRTVRAEAQRALDAGKTTSDVPKRADLRGAMVELTANAEAQRRANDPVEQAKSYIRRRTGKAVFGAEVTLGDAGKGKFVVGRITMTEKELFAYAKRLEARG
jgi:hypothetical protein